MSVDPETASLDELRSLVKQLLSREAIPALIPAIEPLGVDAYAGLPVFLDKPECPRCLPFTEAIRDENGAFAVCHDCGGAIPHSIEFQNRGIESLTVDHLHLHTVQGSGGRQIRIKAIRELCLPCFRLDWAKVNPGKPCDL